MEKFIPKNNIWNIPFLTPIPCEVKGLVSPSECISNRINNEWEFLFDIIEDITLPTDISQDYNFDNVADRNWQGVIVPSELTMQGYDIQNNKEYYYRKNLKVDSNALSNGNRAYIRFEGVYSTSRIWVNNKYITTHIGGFTPFIVDITDYIVDNNCLIVVGITDVEGDSKGIWNVNGEKISDSAWASYYAHHNVCGILRDVTLFYLPKNYLISMNVEADLSKDFKDGVFKTNLLLNLDSNAQIKMELLGSDNQSIFSKSYTIDDKFKIDKSIYSKEFSLNFDDYKYVNAKAKSSDEKYSKLYHAFKRPEIKGE